ncbi:DUF1249 domain-containing protein [Marinobacter bryozoorum]|uniref:DUF1249 domain-containing protein n=1 Tax=Marinobacter bryozoorum TaxID=256324 RepID=UPI00200647D6|nr:DUF1249 domain-containing protein [Marinobacter bryozoorum]
MSAVTLRRQRYVPDLQRLGALCEGNYQRLRRLRRVQGGDLDVLQFDLHREAHYLGRVSISVLQQTRYTETLLLEQVHNSGRWLNNPELTVRVYHDANMAEVISFYGNRQVAAVNDYPNRFMHHPDEKVQLNGFVADWLDYCLRFGHVTPESGSWGYRGRQEGSESIR